MINGGSTHTNLANYCQLVCVEQEQIVVDFGSYCAVFKLEIVDEESSSNLSSGTVKSIELLSNVAFDRGRRQVIANLDKETSVRCSAIVVEMLQVS